MRVLVVTQYFWPENFRVNDLVLGLVARGHEVEVLTGLPNYPDGRFFSGYSWFKRPREALDGVRIVRVPILPRGRGGRFQLTLNYVSFALAASIIGPVACRGRFDAIFVHEPSPITVGLPAIVMKHLKRAPLLFWVLDLWPESLSATNAVRSPWILRLVDRLVRFIYGHCDRVLVQSRGFVERIARQGVDRSRIGYFPNWAEKIYQPSPAEAMGISGLPEGFRMMYAGNIGAAQDFPTILDAAERLRDLPDLKWILVGDGRMADWVAAEVARRSLSDSVVMLGQHPVEAMPEFFAAADAMLVTLRPDPVFALTIPAKIQAYLASGRPIVAALDGEGAAVVRESGAGFACPAGDPEALATAVRAMRALSADERAAMGRRAAAYSAAEFDRDTLFDRLEAWLREAAHGRP